MRMRHAVNGRPRVLVGGIGYRWQRDASFGVVAADELAKLAWPPGIEVADLGYGALYAAQDLADGGYDRAILIAGVSRGRTPGSVFRYAWQPPASSPEEVQERIREAGAGVVDLDHLLIIGQHFNALPPEVVVIEFEPVDAAGGEEMTEQAKRGLQEVLAWLHAEAAAFAGEA